MIAISQDGISEAVTTEVVTAAKEATKVATTTPRFSHAQLLIAGRDASMFDSCSPDEIRDSLLPGFRCAPSRLHSQPLRENRPASAPGVQTPGYSEQYDVL